MSTATKTVLVTGANSGLGLEAARQLALDEQWGRVLISARSQAKADGAIDELVSRTGASRDRFGVVLFDLLKTDTIKAAVEQLAASDTKLDALVLNAGGMAQPEGDKLPTTDDGVTTLFAMNVGGHAHLVNGLLAQGLINDDAAVVFAGSEASRGIPMMGALAPTLPDGELDDAVAKVTRGENFDKLDPMTEYGLVKLVGTAWMTELARRENGRIRTVTVSPGMTGGTSAMDNAPALLRTVMTWVGMPLMKLIGRAHGVEDGAARYVRGITDASLQNGGFYASPGTGTTGDIVLQSHEAQPLLADEGFAAATGRVLDRLTGHETALAAK